MWLPPPPSPRACAVLVACCALFVAALGAIGYARGSGVSPVVTGGAALLWAGAAYGVWRHARWGTGLAVGVGLLLCATMAWVGIAHGSSTASQAVAFPVSLASAMVVGGLLDARLRRASEGEES